MSSERLFLLTTCGTSLLTHGATPEERGWLTRIANEEVVDDPRLARRIAEGRDQLLRASEAERRARSAELNSIGAVLDRARPREVFHLLLHSDTAVGKGAAQMVADALGESPTRRASASLLTSSGLRTDDLASFRAALADLTRQLEGMTEDYRRNDWEVVFNLTAGFKSLSSFLQALGMIQADRCVFLFEGSSAVMEIPRLPVHLDFEKELGPHLEVFRRLAVGFPVEEPEVAGIPGSLLLVSDGQVATSVWGDVVWERVRVALLSERLLPPLSPRVRWEPAVDHEFRKLGPTERAHVNQALDELSASVERHRPLLQRRTFKKLQGDPVPGATHELYAWSHGSTGRLFCREEGNVWRFVKLDGHL